ncbi:MAG: metallophosphoesterase [Actinomycetota bacterium]
MKGFKQLSLIFILLCLLVPIGGCSAGGDAGAPPPTTLGAPTPVTHASTSPAATATDAVSSYTFAVCGDNRITGIENGILQKIVDSAKANGAAFIVNTGDITTSGTRDELWRYREFTKASGISFYNVPGNHDVGKGGVNADYESIIGPYYYSFDSGGDHFVILDNADDATGIDAMQTQWYTADLDSHDNRRH